MDTSRYKDVSALLNAFFDSRTIGAGMQYARMGSSWSTIVGDKLAAHSRPGDIDRGILHVEVEHPGWIQLLQMQQSMILKSVRKAYPELEIQGIVFRLEKDSGKGRIPECASATDRPGLREDNTVASGRRPGPGMAGGPEQTSGAGNGEKPVTDDGIVPTSGRGPGAEPPPEVVEMLEGLRCLIEKREAGGDRAVVGETREEERRRQTD